MATATLVPINYVSTAKQALFDIILGRKYSDDVLVPALAHPYTYLVKGDYETIYKMMVNREMLFGATVNCMSDGSQSIMLWGELAFEFVPDKTVNGKPVIRFGDDNSLLFIDCNNAIYEHLAAIPVDPDPNSDSDDGGDGK